MNLKALAFTAVLFAGNSVFAQPKQVSPLLIEAEFERSLSVQIPDEQLLRDNDTKTKVRIRAQRTVDLVYHLPELCTVSELRIFTEDLAAQQATIEILVSTTSATFGFRSLRVEPLMKSSDSWQAIRFEPAAAEWAIVRFSPLKDRCSFSAAEVSVLGHSGSPETAYKFDESPADAIHVLQKLSEFVNIEISDQEELLFDDAKDGKLDDHSFAEASLLSAGVSNSARREQYLNRIDVLTKEATQQIAEDLGPFEKGQQLLQWLHKNLLQNGYAKEQTDVSTVLDRQTFNCVSSATLYNILGRRLGLDARGIEVPDHAFSIVYDGTQHVDVETTTNLGFNPARNRAALDSFERETGFVYIRESNRRQRREIGEIGMVAITYYNHGVKLTEQRKFGESLVSYFKALSLDPENKSAIKNVLASFANWSVELSKAGKTEQAIAVLQAGVELAPKDFRLKQNLEAVWQQHVDQLLTADKASEGLSQLRAAYKETGNSALARLQAYIFIRPGESLVENKQWKAAIDLASLSEGEVDKRAANDIKDWRNGVVLRWSSTLIDAEEYATAIDVVEDEWKTHPNFRLSQRLAYLAQEWIRDVKDNQGSDASEQLATELASRFPDLYAIRRVTRSNTNRQAKKFLDAKDYRGAQEVFAKALKLRPDDAQLKRDEQATWNLMAKDEMDKKSWDKALDILEEATAMHPGATQFTQNIAYAIQEWSREIAETDSVTAAEDKIGELADRFSGIARVQRMKGRFAREEIHSLVVKKDFDAAEQCLQKHREFLGSGYEVDQLVNHVFHQKAVGHLDASEWEKAIAVFAAGNDAFPKNSSIRKNLTYCWSSWAKEHIDREEWKRAIEIYEQALKAVPNDFQLKQGLRYCKSKLPKP